ncbi:MAG: acyltransferase family protein [Burkholderiaceae bacterium]
MLGSFRFLLAVCVALSHVNLQIAGLNPGVIAVIGFYMTSGYVMTGLLRKYHADLPSVRRFYLDRLLRIFPLYLAVASLTLVWFFWSGCTAPYLQHAPSWQDILNNLLVVPLNYFRYNGSATFTLIPPAWSLGAEIQFYVLMPLLLIWRLRAAAFTVGIVVYACAAWGLIDTDTFGYRLLPGVLIFFLPGSALYDARLRPSQTPAWTLALGSALVALLAWLLLQYAGRLTQGFNRETLLGVGIGLPLLLVLTKLRQHRWDNVLGNLSYGVFLCHFLVQTAIMAPPSTPSGYCIYLAASIALAILLHLVIERPAQQWRHQLKLRHRNK